MERQDPPNAPNQDDGENGDDDSSAGAGGSSAGAGGSSAGAGGSSAGAGGSSAGAGGSFTTHDALRRLEQRLDRASDAAERLIAEAAQSAASAAGRLPPSGWQVPRGERDADRHGDGPGDTELLVHVVQSLRDLIPPELQRRLAEAIRELLVAVRALIDWYLERIDRNRREPVEVEDIPIL
jgi:hypothetical protein